MKGAREGRQPVALGRGGKKGEGIEEEGVEARGERREGGGARSQYLACLDSEAFERTGCCSECTAGPPKRTRDAPERSEATSLVHLGTIRSAQPASRSVPGRLQEGSEATSLVHLGTIRSAHPASGVY